VNKRNWNINDLVFLIHQSAKKELLPRFFKVKESKKDDNSILTEADLVMQETIQSKLKELDENILFLGEEMSQQEQGKVLRQTKQATWVLDPLDGTTNFAAGIPYYATSLALIENGEVVLGLVYDPERDECFFAEKGKGAKYQVGDRPPVKITNNTNSMQLNDAIACIDLKRLPAELAIKIVTQHPFRSQRSFGGVALDWCWLAAGRFDVYLHGKQNIWDYAAGHFILTESGGYSCTLEGESVFVNDLIPRVGVGALNQDLFNEWTDWLEITALK